MMKTSEGSSKRSQQQTMRSSTTTSRGKLASVAAQLITMLAFVALVSICALTGAASASSQQSRRSQSPPSVELSSPAATTAANLKATTTHLAASSTRNASILEHSFASTGESASKREKRGGFKRAPATSVGAGAAGSFLGLESNIDNAKVQVSPTDMATAAGHHHGKSHGKYYMYAEVPKKGAYKMGFKRGNHKHMIERKEYAHKSHVHSYFKWHDKKGKGSHKFEFKHDDKKKYGHY